jgi:chromosome segregation ATPase
MEPNDNRYSTELTSPAKPVAEENRDLDGQVYALAMVVVEQKSREQVAGKVCRDLEDTIVRERSELSLAVHMCRDAEESLAREQSETQRLRNVIDYISARQIDNADLISALRENITDQREEIRPLEELVDSQNISRMEESIAGERSRNCILREEIWSLTGDIDKLQSKVRYLQASSPVEKTAGKRDNYSSDEKKPFFSNCDVDRST